MAVLYEDHYKAIAAGRLDKKVTIGRATGTATDLGGRAPGPIVALCTPYVNIRSKRANEEWHGQHLQGLHWYVVTARYQSALANLTNQDTWVIYGSRYFKIQAVVDVEERHERLEILCEEVVGWQPPSG